MKDKKTITLDQNFIENQSSLKYEEESVSDLNSIKIKAKLNHQDSKVKNKVSSGLSGKILIGDLDSHSQTNLNPGIGKN